MNKHTPGPWMVIDGQYPSFKEITGPSFNVSAVMWATDLTEDDYRKRTADLRLIAAAPDLLEALEVIVATEHERHGYNPFWTDQARAAIAKARGQE